MYMYVLVVADGIQLLTSETQTILISLGEHFKQFNIPQKWIYIINGVHVHVK